MNRRIMLLNAVLAAVLIFAGFQWRNTYLAAKDREQKMSHGGPQNAPKVPWVPLQSPPPVLATGYNTVAQKLLLHPSRNPDIPPPVIETPPPPPPQPMPALPKYHGTMNLDGKQVAILSMGTSPFEEVAAGGTIGPFKLVDITMRDITYEWMGQQVRKSLRESIETAEAPRPANEPAGAPQAKSQIGPVGEVSSIGSKGCAPNDSYTDGAVVDGFRKEVVPTPFGNACRWMKIGK